MDVSELTENFRTDHPRIFFSPDTWPAVKERALGPCRDHYARVKAHADGPPPESEWATIDRPPPLPGSGIEIRDWGEQLLSSAFVYLVEPDDARLIDIKAKLRASAEYYHACYAEMESVNWYGSSRCACFVVLDWLWDRFASEERSEIGIRLLDHVHETINKPDIRRRNNGDHRSGLYGTPGIPWYAGLAFYGEGVDDDRAKEFLRYGFDINTKMLAHRAETSGEDGGEAAPTLGYSFGEYPLAEWNFFHTYKSATGLDMASRWPHPARLPNYIIWNWLPGGLEYGYGDTPHATNEISRHWLYTHMAHIMHFYGQSMPDWAAVAHHLRDEIGGEFNVRKWSIHPFLLTDLEDAPPPTKPEGLPPARHFEKMGQIFMRSGEGPEDTYALFACGGTLRQHRHYDATHFTIYKAGYLALDSGTRQGNTDNLQNYFAQTVAHNCILIKMPGEPPSPYWNGEVFGQAGGQNSTLGSRLLAFETGAHFTYAAGDATPVYNEEKCSSITRQFVFIPPDHFVVFDRARSMNPDYTKTWLIHHANEPDLDGRTWRTDQDRGRILCRTLLPEDATIEKVGGLGKEFLADGVNYAIDAGPSRFIVEKKYHIYQMDYDEVPDLMGRWRMEVKPGVPREEDLFLHVLQVGDRDLEEMVEVQHSVGEHDVEVSFDTGRVSVRLALSHDGNAGGRIAISREGLPVIEQPLASDVMPQVGLATGPSGRT